MRNHTTSRWPGQGKMCLTRERLGGILPLTYGKGFFFAGIFAVYAGKTLSIKHREANTPNRHRDAKLRGFVPLALPGSARRRTRQFFVRRNLKRRCRTVAKAGNRVKIVLRCTECKQRNYQTNKNKKNTPERLELKKYCPFCRKHTLHTETK